MKIRYMLTLLICLATAVAATQVTIRSAGDQFGMMLLRDDVQDDLGLSKQTREKIRDTYSSTMEKNGIQVNEQGNGARSIKGGANFAAANEEFEKAAMKLLSEPQKSRLREISLQLASYSAVDRPEVAKAIKLTDAQKTKIKSLKAKAQEEQTDLAQSSGGRFDQSMMDKLHGIRSDLSKAIAKTLTPDQDAAFKKLQGKPFKGTLKKS